MSVSNKISLSQLLFALVNTLDLVGDDDGHGKRVAQMSYQVGKQFGIQGADLEELFLAGLLHDLGVSKTYVHSHLIESVEWHGVMEHCEVGAKLASSAKSLQHLTPYILHHHDRWAKLQQLVQTGEITEKQALFANIILIVDRVDAFAWQVLVAKGYRHYHMAKQAVLEEIAKIWQDFFSPEVYQAFVKSSAVDIFWMQNDKDELLDFVKERLQKIDATIDIDELTEIAGIFANAVDAKSTYTAEHSSGVANLARYIAQLFELSDNTQKRLYIAGLLHDLGKLDIDDEILEKQAPMDHEERQKMDRHSFGSLMILKHIEGMEDIALWAYQHHEKLNGRGYPAQATDLPFESRILAVADIFQALAQNRPYRGSLSADKIMEIIQDMTDKGELDADIVARLSQHRECAREFALLQQSA